MNGIDFLIGAEMTEEVKTILNELSLEEKMALCSGKDFWHTEAVNCAELPEVMM